MEQNLQFAILEYLYICYEEDPLRRVPSWELRSRLIAIYSEEYLQETQYIKSLLELIEIGYIEAEIEHYRLLTPGKIAYWDCIDPQPTIEEKSYSAQLSGNKIAIYGIVITIIIAVLTIIYSKESGTSKSSLYTSKKSVPLTNVISLDQRAIQTTNLSNWLDNVPNKEIKVLGVPFPLFSNSPVIETESTNSNNPDSISIPIEQIGVERIHLLINMSYATSNLTNGKSIVGEDVCRIRLISENEYVDYYLKAGVNIREWVIGGRDVVSQIGPDVSPLWLANHRESGVQAVIDRFIIETPMSFRNKALKSIEIQDKSQELFGTPDPGIMIFGLSIEIKED